MQAEYSSGRSPCGFSILVFITEAGEGFKAPLVDSSIYHLEFKLMQFFQEAETTLIVLTSLPHHPLPPHLHMFLLNHFMPDALGLTNCKGGPENIPPNIHVFIINCIQIQIR